MILIDYHLFLLHTCMRMHHTLLHKYTSHMHAHTHTQTHSYLQRCKASLHRFNHSRSCKEVTYLKPLAKQGSELTQLPATDCWELGLQTCNSKVSTANPSSPAMYLSWHQVACSWPKRATLTSEH